jgi:hypothetical protein
VVEEELVRVVRGGLSGGGRWEKKLVTVEEKEGKREIFFFDFFVYFCGK